jgi:murein DD-endopeptidase MepM/ murein hydrolase activator NlpD
MSIFGFGYYLNISGELFLRVLWILFLTTLLLFSAKISQKKWKSGEVFSIYLEKNAVPVSLLKSITAEDLQYLSEIQAGERFYELREGDTLVQALIPVGEEMQIHLFRDIGGESYHFDLVPIVCRTFTDTVSFVTERGFYDDINHWTKNPRLGYLLKKYYGKTVNFRKLQKGDNVSFVYTQRSRLGKPFGAPKIKASLIQTHGVKKFIFGDSEGTYYDNVYKNVAYTVEKKTKTDRGNTFRKPINRMRITSKFTYKRWHPILKKYRPHLGIDIGAKRGTRIYATHAGKVIYAGWMGGYGKVVKIKHAGGYVSLYAHQNSIAVKRGQYVKRGQVIGYVGNTGRSTAPHLHFGLYQNGKAVSPMKHIGRKSVGKKRTEIKHLTKHKVVPIKQAKANKARILQAIQKAPQAFRWQSYVRPYTMISERSKYEESNQTF